MREKIVISNYWHRPGITTKLIHGDDAPNGAIVLETNLDDFLVAVAAEMPNPFTVWTRSQLLKAIRQGSHDALEKIKETSTTAVGSP